MAGPDPKAAHLQRIHVLWAPCMSMSVLDGKRRNSDESDAIGPLCRRLGRAAGESRKASEVESTIQDPPEVLDAWARGEIVGRC